MLFCMPKKDDATIKNEEEFIAIKETITVVDTVFQSDKFSELE